MKIMKVISVILLVVIMFLSIITISNAATTEIKPDNFKPKELTSADTDVAFKHTSTILNTITTIGIAVSVIATIILGIKYMLGSVEQKAEYKKTMLPMFIGAILLFAISSLVAAIYNIMQNVNV